MIRNIVPAVRDKNQNLIYYNDWLFRFRAMRELFLFADGIGDVADKDER